ncbi:unnamed protein product, partial [Laminaria digitata]
GPVARATAVVVVCIVVYAVIQQLHYLSLDCLRDFGHSATFWQIVCPAEADIGVRVGGSSQHWVGLRAMISFRVENGATISICDKNQTGAIPSTTYEHGA